MDKDFIRRATKITSFNLIPKDFESLKYKKEIQTLFNTHFFPEFNLANTSKGVDLSKLNSNIQALKNEDFSLFQNLHKYNLKGIGPGEVTLFFLIDNAHLGGGASAGVDLVVGSKKYEVKAVDVSSDGYAINFKTGGTFNTSDIIARLMQLKKDVNAGGEGVNKSALEAIKRKYPDELENIKNTYVDRVYENYFKNHEIIFIRNTTRKMGNIEAIIKPKKNQIQLEVVTSGVIKPKVKIK